MAIDYLIQNQDSSFPNYIAPILRRIKKAFSDVYDTAFCIMLEEKREVIIWVCKKAIYFLLVLS